MVLERVSYGFVVVDGGVCVVAGLARVVSGGGYEAALANVFLFGEVCFAVCEGSEMWCIALLVLLLCRERRCENLPLGSTLLVIGGNNDEVSVRRKGCVRENASGVCERNSCECNKGRGARVVCKRCWLPAPRFLGCC